MSLVSPRFFGVADLEACLDGTSISADSNASTDAIALIQQSFGDLSIDCPVTGHYDDATAAAVNTYKERNGLPSDGIVESDAMRALDAEFIYELFEAKAAELVGTRFDPGKRTGEREELAEGVAGCSFENTTLIEVSHQIVYVLTPASFAAWTEAGGADGTFGTPASDAFELLDSSRVAQEFAELTWVSLPEGAFTLPLDIWQAGWAGASSIGAPTGAPVPFGEDGTTLTLHDAGAVLTVPGAPPTAIPPEVMEFWSAQALAGNSLGAPTGLGFVVGDQRAFGFALGTIMLDNVGTPSLTGVMNDSLQRFFLPRDEASCLLNPAINTSATAIIGAASAFHAMRADIAATNGAADFVYILSWHCNIDLPFDAGDLGSTLRSLLGACVSRGVQVRAMLWAGEIAPSPPYILRVHPAGALAFQLQTYINSHTPHAFNDAAVNFINGLAPTGDAAALLDNRHLPYGSHHQKVVLIGTEGRMIAYVGGVEANIDRVQTVAGEAGSPLFDISIRLEDYGAWHVLQMFKERWGRHPDHAGAPLRGDPLPMPAHNGPLTVQASYTFGRGFPFPQPVQTAAAVLSNGIRRARSFVYIEDQYCVGSPMQRAALEYFLSTQSAGIAVFVLAPDVCVSDLPDVGFRRRELFRPLVTAYPGRVLVFERVGSDGSMTGPNAYVHSKLVIVDDEACFTGSANSNRRSWFHDSEVVATVVDNNGAGGTVPNTRGWVRDFRCKLWSQHLGLPDTVLGDPATDLGKWVAASTGGLPGARVKAFNALVQPSRPTLILNVQAPRLLNLLWDTFCDPT